MPRRHPHLNVDLDEDTTYIVTKVVRPVRDYTSAIVSILALILILSIVAAGVYYLFYYVDTEYSTLSATPAAARTDGIWPVGIKLFPWNGNPGEGGNAIYSPNQKAFIQLNSSGQLMLCVRGLVGMDHQIIKLFGTVNTAANTEFATVTEDGIIRVGTAADDTRTGSNRASVSGRVKYCVCTGDNDPSFISNAADFAWTVKLNDSGVLSSVPSIRPGSTLPANTVLPQDWYSSSASSGWVSQMNVASNCPCQPNAPANQILYRWSSTYVTNV